MYPKLFGVIPSYSFFLVIAILLAVCAFRFFATKAKLDEKSYNYYSTAGLVSIAVGLFGAFFFQAIYDWAKTGVFELFDGLTFMGGLVAGVITFVLFGATAKDKQVKGDFFPTAQLAVPCIALAHCLGRIGCFLAGCCYGKESSHGLYFESLGKTVIPTQLFEAIFLALLFVGLAFLTLKVKKTDYNLIIYALCYSVWRFIIEFWRDDNRGAFLGPLSPSQVQSIILFCVGIGLIIWKIVSDRKKKKIE